MKKFLIYFSLLFIVSCQSDLEKRIEIFENHIGEENAKGITEFVNEFENYLTEKYPNYIIDSAYYHFLSNIQNDFKNWQMIGISEEWEKKLKSTRGKTTFRNEIYLFTDSAWVENNEVKIRSAYYREKDTIRFESGGILMRHSENVDSVLSFIKNEVGLLDFNLNGKYYTGLQKSKGNDTVIINYLDAKQAAGFVSFPLFKQGFLYNKPNFSDYFHKRIFLIELLY